jgi:hypothetical protein
LGFPGPIDRGSQWLEKSLALDEQTNPLEHRLQQDRSMRARALLELGNLESIRGDQRQR